MKYRALIFDFDGTLADTLDAGIEIYNELAERGGFRKVEEDEVSSLRDMKLNEFLKYLGIPKRRLPQLLYEGKKQLTNSIGSLALFDGLDHVLPEMRANAEHVGILTSNSVENVNIFLKNHGLEDVFTFVSSTSKLTGKHKYLRAIRKTFSLEASEIVYVGDEIRDVVAAQKAGIPVAAVGWGFNSPESLQKENPDHFCDGVQKILELKPMSK